MSPTESNALSWVREKLAGLAEDLAARLRPPYPVEPSVVVRKTTESEPVVTTPEPGPPTVSAEEYADLCFTPLERLDIARAQRNVAPPGDDPEKAKPWNRPRKFERDLDAEDVKP